MSRGADLYDRYQVLTALVGVLAHELRNPLHSATLLVEAMGLPGADVATLRDKLRAQFAKLDALVSEAVEPARELALEARPTTFDVRALLARVATALGEEAEIAGATITIDVDPDLSVHADEGLVERVVTELVERALGRPPREGEPDPGVRLVARGGPNGATIAVEDRRTSLSADARRAPFQIAGGGTRLAIARSLAQVAGAQLRLERADHEVTRLAIHVARRA